MTDLATVAASAAAVIAVAMVLLWLVSLAAGDVSIVDVFWGLGFVIIAWTAFAFADGAEPRRWLLAGMTTVWGLRLSGYLARRNLGKGEDYRYVAMRARRGGSFWIVSLFQVFLLQGALMWIVSLPVQAGQVPAMPETLGWLAALGGTTWAAGFFFETVGDLQLAAFKADPANRGRVLDRGLWRYTRHPNYFGDFMVWWGIYLVALEGHGAWWTIVGPLLMSFLLIRVSGAALLEKTIGSRRPGYDDYVRRTSGFFPRPPKSSTAVGPSESN